jgi:hypothetical protein
MTREYLFIVNMARVNRELVPALTGLESTGSCSELRSLSSKVPNNVKQSPGMLGRTTFIATSLEFAWHCLFSTRKAVRVARLEIVPYLFQALYLEEVVSGQALVEMAHFKALTWLLNESSEFSRTFRTAKLTSSPVNIGEATELYARESLELIRHELSQSAVPAEQDDRRNFVAVVDRVLENRDLQLGFTVM